MTPPTKTTAELREINAANSTRRAELRRQLVALETKHAEDVATLRAAIGEIDGYRIGHYTLQDALALAEYYETDMALPDWRRVTDGIDWYVIERVTPAQFHCRPVGIDPRCAPYAYSRTTGIRGGRRRGIPMLNHVEAVARFLVGSGAP